MTRPLLTVYDVACPFCNAGVSNLCRTYPRGGALAAPHRLRVRAFHRAILLEPSRQ